MGAALLLGRSVTEDSMAEGQVVDSSAYSFGGIVLFVSLYTGPDVAYHIRPQPVHILILLRFHSAPGNHKDCRKLQGVVSPGCSINNHFLLCGNIGGE